MVAILIRKGKKQRNMIIQKEIPALTGEKFQYLVHDFNDTTIRFVLNYEGHVDPCLLEQAVRAVVFSVDVLHGSFAVEKGHALWRIYDDIPQQAYFRHIPVEHNARESGYAQALHSVTAEEPVKLRCTLVQDSFVSSLVLCVSHLVADGGDGKYLLEKITEAYNLLAQTGTTDALEVKNGNRSPELLYAGLSKKEQLNLWHNPMPGTKNEFPFPDAAPGTPRMIRRVIPRELMTAAREKARLSGLTANDLILAACYQAFAAVPEVDETKPIGVTAMMDLRKHCPGGDSEGLTNMAGSLKTVMPEGVTGSFGETLAEIGRQTRAVKADPLSGLEGVPMLHFLSRRGPMGLMLKGASVIYGNMSVGVTNLGNLQSGTLALNGLAPADGMMGGPLKKKPGVQVSVISIDGECTLSIVGEYTDQDTAALERFLDAILTEIRDYASN